jgi:hypothetical protein
MTWVVDNVPIELVIAFVVVILCSAILLWMRG